MASLDLQSRQDLFSVVYNQFFGTPATAYDAMNIEVLWHAVENHQPVLSLCCAEQVALDDAAMSKFVLAVAPNPRKAKAECKGYLLTMCCADLELCCAVTDLEKYTEVFKHKNFPKNLALLTECEEISNEFVRACGADVTSALSLLQESIDWIHVTDEAGIDPR